MLMDRIGFDVDGVIADFDGIECFDEDYLRSAYETMNPVEGSREALELLCNHHKVAIVTGRYHVHTHVTVDWFTRHGIPYHTLYTNFYSDFRVNPQYKAEIVE